MNTTIAKITRRIIGRSAKSRENYLGHMAAACATEPVRHRLPCSNLAHALAVAEGREAEFLKGGQAPNIAIVTAYNDMLSAHQPYESYPALIKETITAHGGAAQVAGGVPAMCDGITQGEPGMDLSLISRDVIALSVAIALSHNVFDGALLLGVCDKIMPGMIMGALQFGHLPMVLVPAGPMPSGIANREKNKAREEFAQGRIGRAEMLEVECGSYHCPGTCTFYGTANSNQLIAEVMGLHLPGASFVNPGTPLREALTREAARRVLQMTALGGGERIPLSAIISEKAIVNAIVALLATGGSTNQTMHIVAMARAAGIRVDWDDFSDIAEAVPFITRIYPNGPADINGFQRAGGMAVLIRELLDGGYLHPDVRTVAGDGLERYTRTPVLDGDGNLRYEDEPVRSRDSGVIASVKAPFDSTGGLKVLAGNLGRAVIKCAPLADGADTVVEAPAMVFDDQFELVAAFDEGRMDKDLVAVVRFQGPQAIGMPELHKLITPLGVLMNRGFTVALVTDGRLSGASGKVPSAIHVSPEAFCGGLLAKVRDGDGIRIDIRKGELSLLVPDDELARRDYAEPNLRAHRGGLGRQIFAALRRDMMGAEQGASSLFTYVRERCRVSFGQAD